MGVCVCVGGGGGGDKVLSENNTSLDIRPLDKSVLLKIIFFYFSTKTYVVGAQKNHLNEMVLLSTQSTCLN